MDEAKQFYPLFGLGANVALIFSGRAVKIFSQVRERPGGTALRLCSSTLLCMHVPTALHCVPGTPTTQPMPLHCTHACLPTRCRSAPTCPPALTAGACPCAA